MHSRGQSARGALRFRGAVNSSQTFSQPHPPSTLRFPCLRELANSRHPFASAFTTASTSPWRSEKGVHC
jgi:hypothetical protein